MQIEWRSCKNARYGQNQSRLVGLVGARCLHYTADGKKASLAHGFRAYKVWQFPKLSVNGKLIWAGTLWSKIPLARCIRMYNSQF